MTPRIKSWGTKRFPPLMEMSVLQQARAQQIKDTLTVRVHYSGAAASNSFSMKPGVDAHVGHCGSVRERQRPVSLKMNWKPQAAIITLSRNTSALWQVRSTSKMRSLSSTVDNLHFRLDPALSCLSPATNPVYQPPLNQVWAGIK